MAALTLARLSREWGHAWLITGTSRERTYTATRLRPRHEETDRVTARTLRELRTRLEQLDTDERDTTLPRLKTPAPLPRRDPTATYFRVPHSPADESGG